MFAKDYRKLSKKELEKKIQKAKEELAEYCFEVRTGKETNTAEIRVMKRDLAKMTTVLGEKDFMGEMETDAKQIETDKERMKADREKVVKVKSPSAKLRTSKREKEKTGEKKGSEKSAKRKIVERNVKKEKKAREVKKKKSPEKKREKKVLKKDGKTEGDKAKK